MQSASCDAVSHHERLLAGMHSVLRLPVCSRSFDLVHHPHKADGVMRVLACVVSSPTLLTDPGEPDGVAERIISAAGVGFDPIRLVRMVNEMES